MLQGVFQRETQQVIRWLHGRKVEEARTGLRYLVSVPRTVHQLEI